MSDGPGASPPLLAPPPKRAPGVRRLNKRPVLMGAGAASVVALAIAYTAWSRFETEKVHAADSAHVPTAASPAQALSHASGIRLASNRTVAPPDTPHDEPQNAVITQPSDNSSHAQGQEEDEATKARREAWHAYYANVAELEKDRLQSAQAALKAPTGAATQNSAAAAPGQVQDPVAGFPPGVIPPGALAAPGALAGAYGAAPAVPDLNAQREKQAFLNKPGDQNDDLQATIKEPVPYTVTAGTPIPGVMQGGSNSDLPGMVIGRVAETVCDSATGHFVLIPQESKLLGEYDNAVSAGQTREAVIWHRIIFPDTSSINLGSMEGADEGGYAGFHDRVNRHRLDKFENAFLLSIAAAGAQLSQPQPVNGFGASSYSPGQIAAGALGQQFSQLGAEYARAGLAIPNTLEIRPGYRFTIMVNKDIHLRPYVDRRGFPTQGCGSGPSNPAAMPISLTPPGWQ
ncbi:MAG: hypothetical protein JOZ17_24730 [Acetobacteraceae bacterium]|nr:hypothetical protein [Acetobacteraceae bacterium]